MSEQRLDLSEYSPLSYGKAVHCPHETIEEYDNILSEALRAQASENALRERVRVLEEAMKRVVVLSHFGGLLNSRTDDLMLSVRKATKEYVSLVSGENEKDLRAIALGGGKESV